MRHDWIDADGSRATPVSTAALPGTHLCWRSANERLSLLKTAARDGVAGGRIYDAHIAEIARAAGANVIVSDNRRHFLAALRHGTRVETPAEFLGRLERKPG